MGFKEDVAKIFKKARMKQGFTQEEVAEKAKVHVNYYARIERGEPSARGDVLDRIARALGVKIKLPLD